MNQIERLELDFNTVRRNLIVVEDEYKVVIQLWEVNIIKYIYRQGIEGKLLQKMICCYVSVNVFIQVYV